MVCGLITADVNKPVSYANPNHSPLEKTITIDKLQGEDLLHTCFLGRSCLWNTVSPFGNIFHP